MATACTKPFAAFEVHGVGFDLAERGGERGCQLAEPILAEIAERHALEDFPASMALSARMVAGERTTRRSVALFPNTIFRRRSGP